MMRTARFRLQGRTHVRTLPELGDSVFAPTYLTSSSSRTEPKRSSSATEDFFTDPHSTFHSPQTKSRGRNTAMTIGRFIDAFYAELAKYADPEDPSTQLDKTTVLVAHGDTPKTPMVASGWDDNTPLASRGCT